MSVLVFAQAIDGRFKKAVLERLSYGRNLAKQLSAPLVAISFGDADEAALSELPRFGAEKILRVSAAALPNLDERGYAQIIAQAARDEAASVLLFGNDFAGKALAPRVAVRLGAGCITGVSSLPSALSPFTVELSAFSGKAIASVTSSAAINVLTLASNAFPVSEQPVPMSIVSFAGPLPAPSMAIVDTQKTTGGNRIPVTDAERIVSGGRGMKGPENWGPLEELAALLGAATACSRPVSDDGWRPQYEHVGQTGKVVSPNLYIACGISGAIQHLAGVSASKCIVAINSDPEAPIFQAAQYGIVGDVKKVLPELIRAIKDAG